MKKFKKKHTKIPSQEVIVRMLRRASPHLADKYIRALAQTPDILPLQLRVATLAEFDPNKRQNIRYYPDLHNFEIYDLPNRSLPVDKFLTTFRNFIDPDEMAKLLHDLTNYRLEFHTTAEQWIDVYRDETTHSCMSGSDQVKCYVHPQNKLALAALYAPGTSTVVARTIVNTDELWYIRLFGDELLVKKLQELGYKRLNRPPPAFRMYGHCGPHYTRGDVHYPYFDFSIVTTEVLHETHNPDTGLIEVIINPSVHA